MANYLETFDREGNKLPMKSADFNVCWKCVTCGADWKEPSYELRGPMVKTSDFESENSGSSPGEAAKPQTMLERVAAAILRRDYLGESRVGALEAEELARVAIEEMYDPTDAMAKIGNKLTDRGESADIAWRAMIDAAIGDS